MYINVFNLYGKYERTCSNRTKVRCYWQWLQNLRQVMFVNPREWRNCRHHATCKIIYTVNSLTVCVHLLVCVYVFLGGGSKLHGVWLWLWCCFVVIRCCFRQMRDINFFARSMLHSWSWCSVRLWCSVACNVDTMRVKFVCSCVDSLLVNVVTNLRRMRVVDRRTCRQPNRAVEACVLSS